MGTEAFEEKNDWPVLPLEGVAAMLSEGCGAQDLKEQLSGCLKD